jgi:PIN domain nuclease of toxin-antitoxin system
MRLLLDTHAFIWWDDDPSRLSETALAACEDANNILLLSIASVWEMQIKIQLQKLSFTLPLVEKIRQQQETNGLEILSISMNHVFALDNLPDHHRDPFDRLLVAQSLYENIPLISHDSQIAKYDINLVW